VPSGTSTRPSRRCAAPVASPSSWPNALTTGFPGTKLQHHSPANEIRRGDPQKSDFDRGAYRSRERGFTFTYTSGRRTHAAHAAERSGEHAPRPPPTAKTTSSTPPGAAAPAYQVPARAPGHSTTTHRHEHRRGRARGGRASRAAAQPPAKTSPRSAACLHAAARGAPRSDPRRPHHRRCRASPAAASGDGEGRGGLGGRWRRLRLGFAPSVALEETTRGFFFSTHRSPLLAKTPELGLVVSLRALQ
jgi:hypothetical protein